MTLNLRAVPWQRFLAALSNYPLARLPASLLFSFARGTCNIFHRGGSSPEDIINSRAGISPLAVASDSQVPPGLSSLLFSLASSSATLVLRLGRSPAAVSGRLSSSFRGRKRRKRGARREIWKRDEPRAAKKREKSRELEIEREKEREREESGRLARNWNVLYTPITQKERCCSSSVIPGVYGSHRGCICNPTEREMTWVVGWWEAAGEWSAAGGALAAPFAPIRPGSASGSPRGDQESGKGERTRGWIYSRIYGSRIYSRTLYVG